MMSEQEKINIENPLLQNKAAINLLEMVKDFVNQSFISQGVLASLIVQDGQPPCINVSFTLMQTYTRLYQCFPTNEIFLFARTSNYSRFYFS